jgi:hypothetical protein
MVKYFKPNNIRLSNHTFPSFSSPSFRGFLTKLGELSEYLDLDGDAVDVGSTLQACPSVDTLLFNAD